MKKPDAPSTTELLQSLLSQPTAPFREGFARAEIGRWLATYEIPAFVDESGNLIAGVRSFAEMKTGFRTAMMAHMDHPGFLLEKSGQGKKQICRWYGGAPWKALRGAKVRLFDPEQSGNSVRGKIVKIEVPNEEYDDGHPFTVQFEKELDGFSKTCFGSFDFAGFSLKGDRVRTRAADDLAGCAIALGALIDQELQVRKKKDRRLIAIFTRAEEVGFIGCTDLLNRGLLPKKLWVISLEASKALPGAEAGKGPVLRLGDRSCLFDSEVSVALWKVAVELQKEDKSFHFQRRIMPGGTCEATPLSLFGFQVTGIAVPLLNYHNCGGDGSAQPEMISLSDVELSRKLCFEFGNRIRKETGWKKTQLKEVKGYHKSFVSLLRQPVQFEVD